MNVCQELVEDLNRRRDSQFRLAQRAKARADYKTYKERQAVYAELTSVIRFVEALEAKQKNEDPEIAISEPST